MPFLYAMPDNSCRVYRLHSCELLVGQILASEVDGCLGMAWKEAFACDGLEGQSALGTAWKDEHGWNQLAPFDRLGMVRLALAMTWSALGIARARLG